jgi:hypothetical protein
VRPASKGVIAGNIDGNSAGKLTYSLTSIVSETHFERDITYRALWVRNIGLVRAARADPISIGYGSLATQKPFVNVTATVATSLGWRFSVRVVCLPACRFGTDC